MALGCHQSWRFNPQTHPPSGQFLGGPTGEVVTDFILQK